MVVTLVKYHKLLRYNKKETYKLNRASGITGALSLVLLYLFIFGFVVGAIDIATREVEPIYYFVVAIFFLGSLFIYMAVQVQLNMAQNLRQKNIETMRAFVNAIDLKDAYTRGHSYHVYRLTRIFCDNMDSETLRQLNIPKLMDAALLHDIGKISIRDEILNKEGALTEAEWEIIKTHPRRGVDMITDTCYSEIGDWILYHHERIDGQGYYRLQAKDIPLESRIIAICDTYSALCTNRVYRKKCTHEEALRVMQDAAGTQLDSALVHCFINIPSQALGAVMVNEQAQKAD
ncbi:MAG: HD domain-containing protein [Ruminococcaceae bacterium]|nr:HD domain-containing protein [Oscillospiraceae bacterium]